MKPLCVALTGSIGCGKSLALSLFKSAGWRTFSADACVHAMLESDSAVQLAIVELFGSGVLTDAGGVDRKLLADQVFENPVALEALEGILHPKVRKICQEAYASDSNIPFIAEIPLLFEKKLEKDFKIVVCVACSPQVAQARLLERGWSEHDVRSRLSQQWSLEEKIRQSQVVFWNDGKPNWLAHQIHHWIQALPIPDSFKNL